MKLAEALMIRGEMQTKLASLRQRIQANVLVDDGESPQEAPGELMREAAGLMQDRTSMLIRIHATNHTAALPDGRSMTQALAERDELSARHKLIHEAVEATRIEGHRYSMREIKSVPTVDVKALQKQADDLARRLRELNAHIQQANWQIDLIGS